MYSHYLTKHGKKRLRERVGIKIRATKRHMKSVLLFGEVLINTIENSIYVYYNSFRYVFKRDNFFNLILITVVREACDYRRVNKKSVFLY